jgi:diguanylate cyclase (GGDEF)-like protein
LFSNLVIDALLNITIQMLSIVLTFSIVMMINGRLFYELNKYSDEREKMVEELRRLAITDVLTGVFNRMKLEQLLAAEVLRARRYNRQLSVILIDVDTFKSVNDTFGHHVGDIVLKEIARLLRENVREPDYVGRWGGEEFLVINPETDREGSFALAEKLRSVISSHHFGEAGEKTISLGVATLHGDEREESLLQRADQALYRAKNGGRNRVEM